MEDFWNDLVDAAAALVGLADAPPVPVPATLWDRVAGAAPAEQAALAVALLLLALVATWVSWRIVRAVRGAPAARLGTGRIGGVVAAGAAAALAALALLDALGALSTAPDGAALALRIEIVAGLMAVLAAAMLFGLFVEGPTAGSNDAFELLGAVRPAAGGGVEPNIEARIAALHLLERAARRRGGGAIADILVSYVEANHPVGQAFQPPSRFGDEAAGALWARRRAARRLWRRDGRPRADVRVAIEMLARIGARQAAEDGERLIVWRRTPLCFADLRALASRPGGLGRDLRGARMMGADLRGVDLSGAQLAGADLRGADLTDAVLDGASLIGAQLAEAEINQAQLEAAFGDAKAAEALPHGLAAPTHWADGPVPEASHDGAWARWRHERTEAPSPARRRVAG